MKTVILAAGFGSRLWPLSTSEKPKQFLKLINGESLLEYTYRQLGRIASEDELYVLTLDGLEHHVCNLLPGIDANKIITTPSRHGTLTHTVYALNQIQAEPDEPILFKSVDHIIENPDEFVASFTSAAQIVAERNLQFTLFCLAYRAYDKNEGYCLTDDANRIQTFVEKPSEEMVDEYVAKGTVMRSPFVFAVSTQGISQALSAQSLPSHPPAPI